MILFRRTLLATSLTLLSWGAYCEAPVVDESENFALFENQAANEHPGSQTINRLNTINTEENTPLAHEETNVARTSSNTELLNKFQGLQQDIQELRGQLDVQTHELTLLKQQQLDFYKDLDARLRHEVTSPIQQNTPTSQLNIDEPLLHPVQATRSNPADEQISYLAAYELINNKRFNEALPAMQSFITKYPQGGYTANAHYWLGELYMVKKNYAEAIQHFDNVLQHFPSSSKSSASMLKIGYALAATGEIQAATLRLQSVIKQYPDTHAAQLAFAKLESIGNK
ncbi:MAG: tol-pal system protein YbgF [Legionellales bacterium RIFCSPHIGHO2_12_FULL_42_9]|nr:MAG: tol-pal system protein YbgF [Legionellales bacterium RIFCSPHIGHO2_12_FULL_42_9]